MTWCGGRSKQIQTVTRQGYVIGGVCLGSGGPLSDAGKLSSFTYRYQTSVKL